MAFSIKTSRACTDMLPYKNDAFNFSKTAKSTNSTCIKCTIVPGLLETSLPLTRKMNTKVAVELYYNYIIQNFEILILVTFH